jgi:type II secretory pathway pseudopilin PulG
LVAVLIIVILSAIATQQYNKAVERSRLEEAVVFLRNVSDAQQRRFMNRNSFTEDFRGIDTSYRGSYGSTYYTKGNSVTGDRGNGFAVTLSGTAWEQGKVVAVRTAFTGLFTVPFAYQAERYYVNHATACRSTPGASEFSAFNGASLCADFCGINFLEIGNWCCNDGSSPDGGSEELTGRCKEPTKIIDGLS